VEKKEAYEVKKSAMQNTRRGTSYNRSGLRGC